MNFLMENNDFRLGCFMIMAEVWMVRNRTLHFEFHFFFRMNFERRENTVENLIFHPRPFWSWNSFSFSFPVILWWVFQLRKWQCKNVLVRSNFSLLFGQRSTLLSVFSLILFAFKFQRWFFVDPPLTFRVWPKKLVTVKFLLGNAWNRLFVMTYHKKTPRC